MGLFAKLRAPSDQPARPAGPPRVLFLDDDPLRAEVFLGEKPEAVWVQTAADCIAKLAEAWDEVHLDHDLGGEQFVDHSRDDCGMEVVRWLCLEPRPHLRAARFQVHSHNLSAAMMMGMQMTAAGFQVELRPFGAPPPPPPPPEPPSLFRSPRAYLLGLLRRVLRRGGPQDFGYGYTAGRDTGGEPTPPRPDFGWTRPVVPPDRSAGPAPERIDLSWGRPAVPPPPPVAAPSPPTPDADQAPAG